MAIRIAAASYEEVMISWIAAELLSEAYKDRFDRTSFTLVRAKLAGSGIAALDSAERNALLRVAEEFRAPIISIDGPHPSWTFERATVTRQELLQFRILQRFFITQASCFGDFSSKIRDVPADTGAIEMRAIVYKIAADIAAGRQPLGIPIAVVRPLPAPPLLIEGYKRSMARLWRNEPSIELFLCKPGD
jgi:hypothetical protein